MGDSEVCSPTTSVWDSSVDRSSFVIVNSAAGTTSSAVSDSVFGSPSFVTGYSAVSTTSSAVCESAVGTLSFPATPCSNVGIMGNV